MADPNKSLRKPAKPEGKAFPRNVDDSPAYFSINLRPYSLTGRADASEIKYVYLPMPTQGLTDSFDIGYNSQAMGALGGVASSINQAVSDPSSIVGNVLSGIAALGKNVVGAGAETLGDAVGIDRQVTSGAVDLAAGFINNPNYAVLFKGVEPRKFTFSWTLVPKNIDESKELYDIILSLKQSSLPARLATGNFALNYPHIAHLEVKGPEKNKMLTFAKTGAFIQSIDVKYDGAGHAAFFKGSKYPARIDLSLSFLERGIVTSDDVGSESQ